MQPIPEDSNPLENKPPRFTHSELWQSTYILSKTVFDYLLVIPTLLFLLPLFLLLAILIRLDSPGPIFSRRPAMGRNGREFTAYYFRTRTAGHYPRRSNVGALLECYGLDELPLLFNVLLRDMSLIGPRLTSPREAVGYGRYHPTILQAYPGLTGPWQISGGQNNRLQKELAYVQHWSIWLDIKILLLTVPAIAGNP